MKLHAVHLMLDHVPRFVEADRTWGEIVNRLKGRTSRIMRQEFPKASLQAMPVASVLFAATVGAVSEATIRRYIEAHKGV